jgi:ABC-type antimicrobial peptide transport system permease subunit
VPGCFDRSAADRKSDRLVHILEARAGTEERSGTSYATLRDWRARADTFSGLEGYNGVFACAALLLSLIALYAMCDYEVLTRRREFSIRLALGGSPAGLRRTILSDGLALSVAGIGVGVVAAFVVSRSMNAILFGVANTDWRIYSGVAVTVVICAVLTALRPAFAATSVDPAAVMREP